MKAFFTSKKIDGLCKCSATNWWCQTKRLTGQVRKQDRAGPVNELTDGNMQKLANQSFRIALGYSLPHIFVEKFANILLPHDSVAYIQKNEMSRSQLLGKIAMKFQRLPQCFRGPAIQ